MKLDKQQLPQLLLRIGLAFVFLYAAIASIMHPDEWVGFLPSFIQKMSDPNMLLKLFSIYEIILALWLLSGKFVKYAALLAALSLVGIVIAQPGNLVVTFRDIGLFFMAVALSIMCF